MLEQNIRNRLRKDIACGSLGIGAANIEWDRMQNVTGKLGAEQNKTHLGFIPMHDRNSQVAGQNRQETFG